MKIYIDFDDVICETALYFTKIAGEMFGIDVPYRQVQFFNLQKSFNLSDRQYDELMKAGHIPDNLLSYEETTGASETINKWVDEGHEVFVITGRPFDAYKPSRQWLDEHEQAATRLLCVKSDSALHYYVTGIKPMIHLHCCNTCLFKPINNSPLYRCCSSVCRKQ